MFLMERILYLYSIQEQRNSQGYLITHHLHEVIQLKIHDRDNFKARMNLENM